MLIPILNTRYDFDICYTYSTIFISMYQFQPRVHYILYMHALKRLFSLKGTCRCVLTSLFFNQKDLNRTFIIKYIKNIVTVQIHVKNSYMQVHVTFWMLFCYISIRYQQLTPYKLGFAWLLLVFWYRLWIRHVLYAMSHVICLCMPTFDM